MYISFIYLTNESGMTCISDKEQLSIIGLYSTVTTCRDGEITVQSVRVYIEQA